MSTETGTRGQDGTDTAAGNGAPADEGTLGLRRPQVPRSTAPVREAVINAAGEVDSGGASLMVLDVTSDDTEIVGADYLGNVYRWDRVLGHRLSGPTKVHPRTIWAMALSPDAAEILIGDGDGVVRRWDRVAGTPVGEPLTGHRSRIRGLAVTRDGREVVSASQDGTVRRWDRTTGALLGPPLTGHDGTVRAVALTSDGDGIVTAGQDGTVRRWKRTAGTPTGDPLLGHSGPVQAITAAPDGRDFASGGQDGRVRRWDFDSGRPLGPPLDTGSPVWCLLLTTDGELAAGCADGTLHRWDRRGQRIGTPVAAHSWCVASFDATRDESELVTCGWDTRIRRWERRTGEPTRSARHETRIDLVPRLEITGATPF
ncbi:WD40 repeat domain-containing protein [Streptomyces sp. LMG1-1-1.1]|uniref:WD40 repeat domain-containing protein n=1 Tax=Streptomyces sp. LMG1-1-1.1 TaxID=3135245 RepID=UPI0034663432